MGAGSVESSSRPSLARAVTTTTSKMRTGSRLGPELVGRREELAALEDELGRAVAGEFRLVLLQGEAGAGKSRLGRKLHRMYEIDEAWSRRMEAEVAKGNAGAKLAFTRISFNYFITETVFDYIVAAVDLIAREGWKLLPLYRFDPVTGLWHHRPGAPEAPPSLRDVLAGERRPTQSAPESVLPGQLQAARRIIAAVQQRPPSGPLDDPEVSEEFERIRWFPLPTEGLQRLQAPTRREGSHGT